MNEFGLAPLDLLLVQRVLLDRTAHLGSLSPACFLIRSPDPEESDFSSNSLARSA